ncbi:unnamed protein product [Gongylonema pulchrum]|uniref:Receptor expression-enhancing protein n=1 Tax=Gongylonema pulchrum TaxID=637853 RepID=A0A183DFZ3_9BILA|nr:unnamed protein product [Gongylonema pulchrum]
MVFILIIFGYLIPMLVILGVTIITCWYIREEIRNLYPMLVPFPVAKKACEAYLAKMDKKLIQELVKKQEEELAKGGETSKYLSASLPPPGPPVTATL